MKMKISLAVCTAALFVAVPVFAQGNNSDHSGHDNDGNSAAHRQDAPHGFGSNIVLATPSQSAAVTAAVRSTTSQLRSTSLRTSSGAIIPAAAQSSAYAVLTSDDAKSPAATRLSAALYTAGPKASKIVPDLITGLSALRSRPAVLPSVVATYNDYTRAASPGFIANPPAEYLAVRAVLAQLTTAAANAK